MTYACRQANDLLSESCDASDPRAARQQVRNGAYTGYTAGIAPGFVQANICILPVKWAGDFLLYCQRNPRPCQLIACSDIGNPRLPTLADDLDIRTDVPRYHIFRDGTFVEEVTDIHSYWRDDLVTFALGCSFSFEEALQEAGVRLKFLERNNVAAVYVTNVDTVPAGPFKGPLVVTMRAFTPADAIRTVQITSRFPNVHGAPVHLGTPGGIGGDCFVLYMRRGEGEIIALNGSGWAPAAASLDRYVSRGMRWIPSDSADAVTVPGAVASWAQLIDDHGTMKLADLLQPAIAA